MGNDLTLVEVQEFEDVVTMFLHLRDTVRRQVHELMIGALVVRFENVDLARLAENGYLNVGEMATLRRLGVLGGES